MTEEKEVSADNVKNGQENNEETEAVQDTSERDAAIIRQVEYYFGDLNLPRDKFLREQVKLDDGWVPIEILIKFNRLAKLSTDIEVIAKALNESTNGIVEVSEDNKKVRRNPELPVPEMNEERRKELMTRTIYLKGFPKDSTLDDLLKYFKQFDHVENVVMRKYQDKNTRKRIFKGSVFITFKTKEQAEKFIETTGHKYQDSELLVLWQQVYIEKKQEEIASRKDAKDKKQNKKNQKAQETNEKEEFKLPNGTVFHFTGGTDQMKREDIKGALEPLGAEVAYISFKLGDSEGWVRLTKENAAKEIAEKIPDGKLHIADADVVFKVLEGEEEAAYLQKTIEEMSSRRKNNRNFKQNKGKHFKGKQNRKRKQDQSSDSPPAKVKA